MRAAVAEAGRQPEVAFNIFVIGDEIPDWASRWIRVDVATLKRTGAPAILHGDADAMAEELLRRREAYDISYVITNAAFMETMAPVVARLAGQ